jgi:unsaturated rhamnogalacturonyl hydrolase
MRALESLVLAASFLTTPVLAGEIDVIAPSEDGLVLGPVAVVTIRAHTPPKACFVDGVAAAGSWTKLPYDRHWVGRIPLGAPGNHALELVPHHGTPALVHFESTREGSVAIGDLVAKHFLAAKPPAGMSWDWGPGVFLHGLERFAQVSSDRPVYLAEVESYYKAHLAKGLPAIDHPDVCAPGIAALALARYDGDAWALAAARPVATYLANEKRDALGAIDHLGSQSQLRSLALASGVFAAWAHSIWVDSLMMYGVFSAQWGAAEGDPALLDFGAEQPKIFAPLLQDPVSGLFTHAWDVAKAEPLGARWLRGNGWVGSSALEVLGELPATHASRPGIERIVGELAQGLMAKQMPDGLWDTLAAEPGSAYPETSGSALAALTLARAARLGLAPPGARDQARHAFEAIVARLHRRSDGFSLTGVSGATDPFPEWAYVLVPREEDVDYGVGAFLLLARELENETW